MFIPTLRRELLHSSVWWNDIQTHTRVRDERKNLKNYGCAATSFQPKRVRNRDAGTGVHDWGTGALA